jgi:hypothetical protein
MIRTAAIALAFCVSAGSALAQANPAPAAKPAAPAKQAVLKTTPQNKKTAALVDKPLPAADKAQIDAAELTHFGPYVCDFNQKIDVSLNPKYPGYVDVAFDKKIHTMKPVLSSTGALRLEDVKGVTLLLQIANKSMLMDTKAGRRLVDDCVHAKQQAFRDSQPK